jgi:arabinogalactan oligomer/maltooligosaccharide transport system substrate-binding protein
MKSRTRKVIGLVAAFSVVGSGLTLANPASAVTNLTIWADKGTLDTIKARVMYWDTTKPEYSVTLVERDFGTVREVLKTAVPKGQGPDILAGAAHDWIGNLVAANVLQPIDASLPPNFKDDFVPGALQAMKYNGKYYGVPGWTENIAILRNVSKARTAAKSVNDIKDGELGINYDATNSDPYHLYPFQTMFKAPIFNQIASGPNKGDWSNTVAMGGVNGGKFAKWLASKGTKFFGPPNNAKILCDFLNPAKTTKVKGKIVKTGGIKYWVTGAWNIKSIQDGAAGCTKGLKIGSGYSIDPLPAGPTGTKPQQFLGIRGYLMVASGPNNKTNVPGAVDLMRYMSSQATQYSIFDNANKTPANLAALNQAKSDPVVRGFANAANTVPMPNSPAMAAAWTIWGKAQTRIIQGKEKSPEVAWTNMTKALQLAINKVK